MSLSSRGGKFGFGLFLLFTCSMRAEAWNTSLSADISSPFVQGDPSMSISAGAAEDFSKKWGLAVSQAVEKNFYVDSSTKEWELSDTVVALNLYPRTLIPDVNWTLRLQMTLPLSHISQVNEIYSKPEARLYSNYPLTDSFRFGLNAFARLTLSRYETAAAQDGIGGAALPKYSYGAAHSGNWQVVPDWTFAYSMSYTEIVYHSIEPEGLGNLPVYQQPDHAYSFGLNVSWAVAEKQAITASYSYGGLLLQPGLDDYVLYDQEDSRWSLGYSYSF